MNKGKQFLSNLKLHSDYLKWTGGRYETWDEACEDIISGHRGKGIDNDLDFALTHMKEKRVLASQRSLQYRPEQIKRSNERIYNCSSMYIARNRSFQELFWLALNGCGVGGGLLLPFVDNLSRIEARKGITKTFIIDDSREGWADSLGVLLSSYFIDEQPFPEFAGCKVKFDYSNIRDKGTYISGGFKAPGYEGLKSSLEIIEKLLDNWIIKEGHKIRPILAMDICCHAADAVLSGGIRRAALNFIVDPKDEEAINAKTGNWWEENPQRSRANNSVILLRSEVTKEEFVNIVKKNQGISDIGFVFADSWFDMFNPCFEISKIPMLVADGVRLDKIPYNRVKRFISQNKAGLGVAFCNLTEINAEKCPTSEDFFAACKAATILGTVQASYTDFPYLGKVTEDIVKREALIGVSITGWMNNLALFDEHLLKAGANLVKDTNRKIAKLLGINPAARTTTVNVCGL